MTVSRIDKLLLSIGALLILISSYQLFLAKSESDAGLKVGTLTTAFSIVKTKSAVSLDWRDASQGLDVTENQLIYTDSASSAEVKFLSGNGLQIGENSLVKLSMAGEQQGMDISKGFIRAKLAGNQALKVQLNGEDFILTGDNADVQINLQDKKGEIGVLSGEVQLESEGVKEELDPLNALEINGDKVTRKKIHFKTMSPEIGSVKYIVGETTDVSFSWEPLEAATLMLGTSPDLKNPIIHIANPGHLVTLKPGLWYFKVKSAQGTSLTSSFRVIQEIPPKIIRPKNGDQVSLIRDEIYLEWDGRQEKRFQVEWNDGEIHSVETQQSNLEVKVKQGYPFSWRVKVLSASRPDAQWSEWQDVKTHFIPPPQAPTELSPDEFDFQVYNKEPQKIDLSWKGEGAFEIEIIDPKGVSQTSRLKENLFPYEALISGEYKWRIRGVDDYLRVSAWSEWKSFTVTDASQNVENGAQRIQLKKPDQSVTFNWVAGQEATSVFELSKDPEFKTVVKKVEVKKDSVEVNIPEVGYYYWRSRQYNPDGTYQVSEPKRVIIEPVPAPKKPEKLPDLQIEIKEEPVKTSFLNKILDFILSSAIADDVKGTVKFTLPVEEEAKGYVVRIYRDEALSDLVYEKTLQTKEFEWNNATPGTYFWQYAVIDFWDRKSLFSDPSQLIVKGEEILQPEKPRLLSPIRAQEIEVKNLILSWTHSPKNSNYKAQISHEREFAKILGQKETKNPNANFSDLNLSPDLYFWRVLAFNKKGQEIKSNTGRFTIIPPLEKTIIEDLPPVKTEAKRNSRAFLAWAPSMDSYTFNDDKEGNIDGNALMSFLLTGTIFRENFIFNGELLRQTGEVFEGEKYLFQRILVDAIYLFGKESHHKWGLGLVAGQTSGVGYEINTDAVKSTSVSSPSYGVIFRNYLTLNQQWELQGRGQYLLGDITQIDLGADVIRKFEKYLFLTGVSYSSRDYELNSGKQTSLKFSVGIGRDF